MSLSDKNSKTYSRNKFHVFLIGYLVGFNLEYWEYNINNQFS